MRAADKIQGVSYGSEALAEVGAPPYFVDAVLNVSNTYKTAITFRGNQPIQAFLNPAAPKPGFVKAKNSAHALVKGVIPFDSKVLGRIEKDGSMREYDINDKSVIKYPDKLVGNKKDANGKITESGIHHQITLEEVTIGLKNGELKLLEDPVKNNILKVSAVSDNPKINQVIYGIDLGKFSAPTLATEEKRTLARVGSKIEIDAPSWWDEKNWGNFTEQQHHLYSVNYQATAQTPAKPLMVLALQDDQKHSVPIRMDQDLLWIAKPTDEKSLGLTTSLAPEMHQPLNTFDKDHGPSNTADLMLRLFALDEQISQQTKQPRKFPTLEDIPAYQVAALGNVTPFEAYTSFKLNDEVNLKVGSQKIMKNMVQHGAENRSPFAPSDLDGKMLHIWNGQLAVTHTEKELASFVLKTPGYLEKNMITIHPEWNMKLWAPVVAQQIELKQPVAPKLLESYTKYITGLHAQAVSMKDNPEALAKMKSEHMILSHCSEKLMPRVLTLMEAKANQAVDATAPKLVVENKNEQKIEVDDKNKNHPKIGN